MDYEFREVLLARIDWEDQRYRISSPYPHEDLARSIDDLGLIQPPILLPVDDQYIIVSGFARVDACKNNLAWEHIPAALIKPSLPARRYPLIAIADNTAHRTLNIVEQTRAMRLLETEYRDRRDIETAAKLAGLGLSAGLMVKLKKIDAMPEVLQVGLIEGTIALPVALKIHEMKCDVSETELVARLLSELNVSLNRQREIVEAIQAITRCESITINTLLNEGPVSALRSNGEMDKSQKAHRIRHHLRKRRYPRITAAESQFADVRKQLKLKEQIQLTAPPNFESRTYRFSISFNTIDELQRSQKELRRVLKTSAINRLWDLYE